MRLKQFALLVLFGSMLVPGAQAQIRHIEMHVEGMT